MGIFDDMIEKTSLRYHNKIKKNCEPLATHFSVKHFSYSKITDGGNFTCLSNYPAWIEYYFHENFYFMQPHFRHPSFYQSGIILANFTKDDNYRSMMEIAKNKFSVNFCLGIVQKNYHNVEIFGFDLSVTSSSLENILINELALLKMFIKKFKEENISLLNKLDDTAVDIKKILGSIFSTPSIPLSYTMSNRQACLKEMGLGFNTYEALSSRELEVMSYLLHGGSAHYIANQLHLSKRTIEHYIENIKNKLQCQSKFDLISIAHDLDLLGFFNKT